MKTLNNLLLCLTLFGLLTLTSCLDFCNPIERPKDLQPINWESYNDVKTVYYNCVKFCSEGSDMEGKKVKVCGWNLTNFDGFVIGDDSIYNKGPAILISSPKPEQNGKYYITGTISLPCLETVNLFGGNCSITAVEILADSICFEK
ncbi:MAG: hypothetical protein BGO29_05200 [Bacteroidales bacterium 36-12]|nr:MAG: hypothetical protein BGO29_05200 [Bacteroidales bacterium 36-12]